MSDGRELRRRRLFVFLLPLLLSLPFLGRALFIDDGYFVKIAGWLAENPARPYDFVSEDVSMESRGWEEDGTLRMLNPLAHHYVLAAVKKAAGDRLWILRLVCVLLAGLGSLFVFELTRRWTSYPVTCASFAALIPAQWLTAHSLLIDSTMAAFFVGGLFFFIRATETDSIVALVLSGVLMGLALLSKYTALFILPLSAAWLALRWRKLPRPALFAIPWAIAFAMFAAYNVWTDALYGRPHFLAASERAVGGPGILKALELLVFFSGATLLPLVVWVVSSGRERLIAGLCVFIGAVFFGSKLGGFSKAQALLMSLWTVTTPFFLWSFWACRSAWVRPRDPFIFIWSAGFLFMMALVMDWVAARYLLVVTPAIALIAIRLMEIRHPEWTWHALPALALAMVVTGAGLAYADYQQAEAGRRIAPWLSQFHPHGKRYYLGDVFTVNYLREQGWEPIFHDTPLASGDVVLARTVATPAIRFMPRGPVWREVARYDVKTRFPIKVMDVPGAAGFYASLWGALPFTFSTGPWESFRLFEVMGASTEKTDAPR